MLSRIADYGLDYSQRANKLAHHVILDNASERLPGGPASLISIPGFMREQWSGEPKVVALKPIPREPRGFAGICRSWQEMTGDAGWAGVLAESFLKDHDRLVILLFAPGQEILPLFSEAISLLPPDRRWEVTFSTYFTGLATGTTCLWRAMVHDSKEARESLRFVNALRIDLTADSIGPASGGTLVEAARTGIRPASPSGRTPPSISGETPDTGSANPQEEFAQYESAQSIGSLPIPQKPPKIASNRPGIPMAATPRRGRRLADVIEEEFGRRRPRKFLVWGCVSAIVVITSIVMMVCCIVDIRNFISRVFHDKTNNDTADSNVVTPETQRTVQEPILPKALTHIPHQVHPVEKSAKESPSRGGGDEIVKDPGAKHGENGSNQSSDDSSESKVTPAAMRSPPLIPPLHADSGIINLKQSKTSIFSFSLKSNKKTPLYQDFRKISDNASVDAIKQFESEYGSLPPRVVLYVPEWLKWRFQKGTDAGQLLEIVESESGFNDALASIDLVTKPDDFSFEYVLKLKPRDRVKYLAWCAIEVKESKEGSVPKLLYFYDPAATTLKSLTLKENTPKYLATLPFENVPSSQIRVDEVTVAFAGNVFRLFGTSFKSASTAGAADCSLNIDELGKLMANESGINSLAGNRAKLLIAAKSEVSKLQFSFKLGGVFGSDGLLHLADEGFRQEIKELEDSVQGVDSNIRMTFNKVMKSVLTTNDISSGVDGLKVGCQKYISEQLELEYQQINKEDKVALTSLRRREDLLKKLPDDIASIHSRYQRFASLRDKIQEIRITDVKVSYDLFEMAQKTRGDKKVRAYVINFDETKSIESRNGQGGEK